MIDLRYLVITVAGFFLALGMGLLIGAALVPQTKLPVLMLEKQKQIIQSLEKKFDDLKQQNERNQKELQTVTQWVQKMMPFALEDRLTEKAICLLTHTDAPADILSTLENSLKTAGARQVFHLSLGNLELFDDKVFLSGIQGQLGLAVGTKRAVMEQIGSRLGKELMAKDKSLIAFLKEKTLAFASEEIPDTCEGVVWFLAGSEKEKELVENIFLPMTRSFRQDSPPVVAVQPEQPEKNYIPLFKRERVSTLSGIEKFYTHLTLVLMLSGYRGHFGAGGKDLLLPAARRRRKV